MLHREKIHLINGQRHFSPCAWNKYWQYVRYPYSASNYKEKFLEANDAYMCYIRLPRRARARTQTVGNIGWWEMIQSTRSACSHYRIQHLQTHIRQIFYFDMSKNACQKLRFFLGPIWCLSRSFLSPYIQYILYLYLLVDSYLLTRWWWWQWSVAVHIGWVSAFICTISYGCIVERGETDRASNDLTLLMPKWRMKILSIWRFLVIARCWQIVSDSSEAVYWYFADIMKTIWRLAIALINQYHL